MISKGFCGYLCTLVLLTVPAASNAQSIREEYVRVLDKARQFTILGEDAGGEIYDPYTGTVSLQAVDVVSPGGGEIPLEVRRLLRIDAGRYVGMQEQFGNWEMDVPYLFGTFAADAAGGWNVPCSRPTSAAEMAPASASGFAARLFWHGNFLHEPGAGDQEILYASTDPKLRRPTGPGDFKYITRNLWIMSCLPALKNAGGEGYLAVSPAGTKYYFDWLVEYSTSGVTKPGQYPNATVYLPRKEVRIYPSLIEDRHGNWMRYEWQGKNLSRILAKDGREITFQYGGDGRVDQVMAPGRIIRYDYGQYRTGLQSVIYPDDTRTSYEWSNTQATSLYDNSTYELEGHVLRYYMDQLMRCSWMRRFKVVDSYMRIGLPSGAIVSYQFKPLRRGRNGVTSSCIDPSFDSYDAYKTYNLFPVFFDNLALSRKEIFDLKKSHIWDYSYGSLEGSYSPAEDGSYGAGTGISTTEIKQPDGSIVRYQFGNRYLKDEGLLLSKTQSGPNASRAESFTYHDYSIDSNVPFPVLVGSSGQQIASSLPGRMRPVNRAVISESATNFERRVEVFDEFARPIRSVKTSSLGFGQVETVDYFDALDKWVLGLEESRSLNGVQSLRTEYDNASLLPYRVFGFGDQLLSSYSYHLDGAPKSITDSADNTTRLDDWWRGVPRTVTFADGRTQRATVNPDGTISGSEDENGFVTNYAYDSMGRLTRVDYVQGDSVNWAAKIQAFSKVALAELGVPAGHWKQTTEQGGYRKEVHFDGLLRPVVEREYDVAAPDQTQRFKRFEYDFGGRITFASYPSTTSTATTGVWTEFDALGRVTSVVQNSELGAPYDVLITTTEYLPGFKTRVTNPRKDWVITQYMAFDQPTTEWPVLIEDSAGRKTQIDRDGFGKPRALVRSGTGQ